MLNGTGAVPKQSSALEIVTISRIHQLAHEGSMYFVSHRFSAVADTASVYLLVKGGGNNNLHALFQAEVGGDCNFDVFEAPTTTADGTAVTAYNKNRLSANTADASFYHTPTVSADGTAIKLGFIPGGGKKGSGGETLSANEWILDKDENYLLKVTNNSGAATDVVIALEFYDA